MFNMYTQLQRKQTTFRKLHKRKHIQNSTTLYTTLHNVCKSCTQQTYRRNFTQLDESYYTFKKQKDLHDYTQI